MKIKLDLETIGLMQYFERFTGAKVKDCFTDNHEMQIFVVDQGQLFNAVGKNGVKVKALEAKLNRKLKIVEFNPELSQFIRNVLYPLKTRDIQIEDEIVTITPLDSKTRGLIIGRVAQNLRNFEAITKRYFNINEIKVV
ncbi:NusA-like transcription termination signal-binding factor [Candidatus Woesearchaeota archaeon]|nr:NusA-like transcription termination signal-binding factor [Candidatus Woesearchaeota archaeon]